MAPGKYLERRRVMAGHSVASLARDLIALTGFGTQRTLGDLYRLQLTLIAAEEGTLHHSVERVDLIRNFVPLDPTVYFRLIERDRDMPGLAVLGVCRVCACTFHDPCSVPVDPAAGLGASTCCWAEPDLCSACADATRNLHPIASAPAPLANRSIAEQLRELGERMQRIAFREDVRAARACLDIEHTQTGQPPFLRLVPATGEN